MLTQLFENNDASIITWFPRLSFPETQIQNDSKSSRFQSLRRSVDAKHLMLFQSRWKNRFQSFPALCDVTSVWKKKDVIVIDLLQEPITRTVQLSYIPVTALSQTVLFLVWIYREFRPPQEPQWPITSSDVNLNWRYHLADNPTRLGKWHNQEPLPWHIIFQHIIIRSKEKNEIHSTNWTEFIVTWTHEWNYLLRI